MITESEAFTNRICHLAAGAIAFHAEDSIFGAIIDQFKRVDKPNGM